MYVLLLIFKYLGFFVKLIKVLNIDKNREFVYVKYVRYKSLKL